MERVFDVLENYGNVVPLLSVDLALSMARSMTYKGVHPSSSLHAGSAKGVRIAKKAMRVIEQALDRKTDLTKRFVRIETAKEVAALERYHFNWRSIYGRVPKFQPIPLHHTARWQQGDARFFRRP